MFIFCFSPGRWRWDTSEPDGPSCRSAFHPEQALLFSACCVVKGSTAASRVPIITGHSRTERTLLQSDPQVTNCGWNHLVSHMFCSHLWLKKTPCPLCRRERVNKRRVKEMVKEFTLLCRGLHGTEYAAEYWISQHLASVQNNWMQQTPIGEDMKRLQPRTL